jgi:hypothetical protein
MILRRFMHRTKKDEGRAEEIDSHLAHEQDAHAARGLSHQEARRQAHLRFGNPRGTRERVWRYRSFPWVEEGWRDCASPCVLLPEYPGLHRSRSSLPGQLPIWCQSLGSDRFHRYAGASQRSCCSLRRLDYGEESN